MGYDLKPNNKELKPFHFPGYLHLLEQCGAYFTCIFQGARWYSLWDERMSMHRHVNEDDELEQVVDQYPSIICNCGGFDVTEEETKVMARIARNYAAIQRTVEPSTEDDTIFEPQYLRPFPKYIRRDWVDQYEQFAEWAEQSQGFKIF